MPKILYLSDDSDSDSEQCPVMEMEPETKESVEPEPVPTVIIQPKKPRQKKEIKQAQQSWNEFVDDKIETPTVFTCTDCNAVFKRKHFLQRHVAELRCPVIREKTLKKQAAVSVAAQKPVKKKKPVSVPMYTEESSDEEEEEVIERPVMRKSKTIRPAPIPVGGRPQMTFSFH
jgi:hypothetical protein